MDDCAKIVQQVVKKHGGSKFKRAKSQEEGDLIWQDRKNALFTAIAYAGGDAKGWLTDVWYIFTIFAQKSFLTVTMKVYLFRISLNLSRRHRRISKLMTSSI